MGGNVTRRVVRSLVVVGVLGAGFALTGCSGGSTGPSASKAPTKAQAAAARTGSNSLTALEAVYASWVSARNAENSADQSAVAASNALSADETNQNQRLQTDANTIQANEYGLGCSADIADFAAYNSCVQSDNQKAQAAQSDEAVANAQLETDRQQFSTDAATLESALSGFLGQIADINWPAPMQSTVADLVKAAQAFRDDTGYQAAENGGTPASTESQIQAQAATDIGSLNDALNAVNAVFVHLGVASLTGA